MGTHRPLAGGSLYPLRPVASAIAQVRGGHFYEASGIANNGPVTIDRLDIDSITLVYHDLGFVSVQAYYVPMYKFTDSKQQVSVYYPAVTDDYLAWPSSQP